MTSALWIFGYGSLIWDPGFRPAETRRASLSGYVRGFCMRSIHHRGTPEAPGLVLALDASPGAVCEGLAYRVTPGEEDAVTAYLRARELIASAYLEQRHPVALDDGRTVAATLFVVDRAHVQYCGALDLDEQAEIIARASGGRGRNDDYLHQTFAHLTALGIEDPALAWLDNAVRKRRTAAG